MNKYERQSHILQIIKDNTVQTQEDLAGCLNQRGIFATQATISRDIKELRLVKVQAGEVYKYATSTAESAGGLETRLKNVFSESVISASSAENIVVVKTLSGMAQAAAAAIDAMEYVEVLGCIAGDDTIMVVATSEKSAAKITAKLKMMIK